MHLEIAFKQIAQTYYNHVHVYDVNWGEAVVVDDFINYLKQLNVPVTAVFTQFCETSTGVIHPVHQVMHLKLLIIPYIYC